MSVSDHFETLCKEAQVNIEAREFDVAVRELREATSIKGDDAKIKELWDALEYAKHVRPVVDLCQRWLDSQSDDDGEKALDHIHQHELSPVAAQEGISVVLKYNGDSDMADQLFGVLSKHAGARKVIAEQFRSSPTEFFRKVFDYGDDSMDGLVAAVLSKPVWPDETLRAASVRDLFQLVLAEAMDAALDFPERAMKGISRLLAAESATLKGIVDADGFDTILANLDYRLPASLRSHATIATSKLLELAAENGNQLISNYVTARVQRPLVEGLILAFSAAAAVFPMVPTTATQLFLSEGFLPSFVPMVEARKNRSVDLAALELLSAACMDKACREGIAKFCVDWLQALAKDTSQKKRSSGAGLILVKIQHEMTLAPGRPSGNTLNIDAQATDLTGRFAKLILDPGEINKQDAVEGLAYASLKPQNKESLSKNKQLLSKLISHLNDAKDPAKSNIFGGLTIFAHLTSYRPALSEEQKKMAELKAYANTQKPIPLDPFDDDSHVAARCKRVLDAGIMPLLVNSSKSTSPAIVQLVLQVIFALAQNQKDRGIMSQQGAVKILLHIYEAASTQTDTGNASRLTTLRLSAHALARILISVNPRHVLSSTTSLLSPIRPLTSLLTDPNAGFGPSSTAEISIPQSPPLLATFEALLALTNLASADASVADAIVRAAWPHVEDLLLSDNELVQRATAELACNLCACAEGVARFADGSGPASNRLHVLLALADAEDVATRRAAGGALAMLTEWAEVVAPLLKRDRAVEILLGLCEDEDGEELVHRGLICVLNVVTADGEAGALGRRKVMEAGAKERIANALRQTKDPNLLGLGVQILKALA